MLILLPFFLFYYFLAKKVHKKVLFKAVTPYTHRGSTGSSEVDSA